VTSVRPPCGPDALRAAFGAIDVYVFDQLLRGRITPGMRVLDAGCGSGRNVEYLLRCGADVHGVDADQRSVRRVRQLARELAPGLPEENFRTEALTELSFPDASFDAVICCAVLHFVDDEAAFRQALDEMFRVLRPGGVFFARLASSIGIEDSVEREHDRWHTLPDGSSRFLVDATYLAREGSRVGGEPIDPLKTTVVEGARSMTTWVLRKTDSQGVTE
jgi:SAM-dependent methyltransferase